jgi:hypothetical protein
MAQQFTQFGKLLFYFGVLEQDGIDFFKIDSITSRIVSRCPGPWP